MTLNHTLTTNNLLTEDQKCQGLGSGHDVQDGRTSHPVHRPARDQQHQSQVNYTPLEGRLAMRSGLAAARRCGVVWCRRVKTLPPAHRSGCTARHSFLKESINSVQWQKTVTAVKTVSLRFCWSEFGVLDHSGSWEQWHAAACNWQRERERLSWR